MPTLIVAAVAATLLVVTTAVLMRLSRWMLLAFAFTLCSNGSAAYANPISIDSAVLFNSTGILASGSEGFVITATGTVDLAIFDGPYVTDPSGTIVTAPPSGSGAASFFTFADPTGVPPAVGNQKRIPSLFFAQLPGGPFGALVGGFSPSSSPTGFGDFPGGFSLIGSSGIITAPGGGGFLFLAVNDINNTFDNFGSFTAQVSSVPEPASLVLVASGLSGLVLRNRRRKTTST
jgi:PEP-CTERM motif